MKKLVKNGNIILDGTEPLYIKEKQAFLILEELQNLLEQYGIESIEELREILGNAKIL